MLLLVFLVRKEAANDLRGQGIDRLLVDDAVAEVRLAFLRRVFGEDGADALLQTALSVMGLHGWLGSWIFVAVVAGISLGTSSLSKWTFIAVPLTSVLVGCGGVASTVIACAPLVPTWPRLSITTALTVPELATANGHVGTISDGSWSATSIDLGGGAGAATAAALSPDGSDFIVAFVPAQVPQPQVKAKVKAKAKAKAKPKPKPRPHRVTT